MKEVKAMSWTGYKYDSAATEVLYGLMDWWAGEASGSGEAPIGWYTAPIEIMAAEVHTDEDISTAVAELRAEHNMSVGEVAELTSALVGVHILGGDDRGFVYSVTYPDLATAQDAYDQSEIAYSEWLNQCMDCGSPTFEGECTLSSDHAGAEQ